MREELRKSERDKQRTSQISTISDDGSSVTSATSSGLSVPGEDRADGGSGGGGGGGGNKAGGSNAGARPRKDSFKEDGGLGLSSLMTRLVDKLASSESYPRGQTCNRK